MSWYKRLFGKRSAFQPPLHLLHRWRGGYVRCAECGSADQDAALHLRPSSRVLGILDVMDEMSARRESTPGPLRTCGGSLLELAAAVFYVDEAARVYTAHGWSDMVFVELGDPKRRIAVQHFSERYRTMGVLMVYVGCEG